MPGPRTSDRTGNPRLRGGYPTSLVRQTKQARPHWNGPVSEGYRRANVRRPRRTATGLLNRVAVGVDVVDLAEA